MSVSMGRQRTLSVDTKRAFYMAEAGISEGLYGLMVGKSGNVGTADLPATFGDGVFWVEAEDIGENRTLLTSTVCAGRAASRCRWWSRSRPRRSGRWGSSATTR